MLMCGVHNSIRTEIYVQNEYIFFWLVELPRRLLLFMVVVVVVVVVIRSFCSRPTKLDSTGPTLSNLANVTIVIY